MLQLTGINQTTMNWKPRIRWRWIRRSWHARYELEIRTGTKSRSKYKEGYSTRQIWIGNRNRNREYISYQTG